MVNNNTIVQMAAKKKKLAEYVKRSA